MTTTLVLPESLTGDRVDFLQAKGIFDTHGGLTMTTTLVLPESLTGDRVDFLQAKGIDEDIARVDLEMVKMKLAEPEEGAGWNAEQTNDAEIEYKRYLTLCRKYPYPKYSIVPNKIMDTMWHYHILDTRAYVKDSEAILAVIFTISRTLACAAKTMRSSSNRLLKRPSNCTSLYSANRWHGKVKVTAGMIAKIDAGMRARTK